MIATRTFADRLCLLAALLLAPALGCDPNASGRPLPPTHTGEDSHLKPEGEFEGESMDELQLRLEGLTGKQDALVAAGNRDPGKCEELCDLSRSICEIQTKMCEIADDRVADDEYQALCRKAKQRCQAASESCVRCVEHHERAGANGPTPEPATCEGE